LPIVKRIYLRLSLVCLFFLSALSLAPHRIKTPFSLAWVPFQQEWEIEPLSLEEEKKISAILERPLTYLSKGNQSYVFESEGGEYVVKFFRYRFTRFKVIHFCQTVLYSHILHKKTKDSFDVKINKTCKAARLAFVEAQKFTQVVFCHLNLTQKTLPIVKITIPKGTYSIPLDRYRFVVQKKVTPFVRAMQEARKEPSKMKVMINSFLALIEERSRLGISNTDPNLGPNFGFLEDQAVEMDFGNYRKISDQHISQRELEGFKSRLRHWLEKNAPEYVPLFVSCDSNVN